MRITDIPEFKDRGSVLTCPEDMPLQEAVQLMADRNFGSILITDAGGLLTGIFTERDLLRRVVGMGQTDQMHKPVRHFMTQNPKTARYEDEVAASMRRMSQGRFRHLPIVDEQGRPVGLVSQGDFVAVSWSDLWGQFVSKTKGSLFNFTQVWLMIIAILIYSVIVMLISGVFS